MIDIFKVKRRQLDSLIMNTCIRLLVCILCLTKCLGHVDLTVLLIYQKALAFDNNLNHYTY